MEHIHVIRPEEVITALINEAIIEAVIEFEDDLLTNDKTLLHGLINEKSTNPQGRITYLRQITKDDPKNANLVGTVNNILQSLRERLSLEEQKQLTGGIQIGLLDNIL